MKNKRGLTLVEVILAIAILGIISVLLFPALTGQYSMLRQTRIMTENLYRAQQDIEVQINSIKSDIQKGNDLGGLSVVYYSVFSGKAYERTVGGYDSQVNVYTDNDNISLNAIVADSQLSAFPVSTISNAQIWLANNSGQLDYAYWNTNQLRVLSDYSPPDPEEINMFSMYRWYVSREGFNMPPIADPKEIELGKLYPRFPDDYVVISNYMLSELSPIYSQYAGRHVIFSVTPVSTQMKTGETVVSNSVFINGLPYRDGLELHLDASMIPIEDASAVRVDANDKTYVAQWLDISGNDNKAAQANTAHQPELITEKIADAEYNGQVYETFTRIVRFSGQEALSILDHNSLDLNNKTLIVVAKSESETTDKTIISKLGSSGAGWKYGWSAENQLGFTIKDQTIDTVSADTGVGLDGKWHIMVATTSATDSTLSIQMDSNPRVEAARTASSIINNRPITIGYDGNTDYSTFDVAEILVYDKILDAGDLYSVYTYLDNKYNPAPANISIYALKPFADTAAIGESYTLPSSLDAYMSNGTISSVGVSWTPTNLVDTSTAGVYTYIATANANPDKTTNGQITVASYEELFDDEVDVEQNAEYSLPATVIGRMSSGTLHSIPVDWYNSSGTSPVDSSVDTSVIGSYTFVGKAVADPSITMTMTVNVLPIQVTGITVSPESITLSIGQTQQLIAEVYPADAYNKNVIWSNSNPTAVTLTSDGLVTADGSGTATITATTEDGGHTAVSTIVVNTPVTGVSLNVSTKVMARNTSYQLIATVSPSNATNPSVTWTSNSTHVTVDSNGVVRVLNSANNNTQATITVKTDDGDFTATCLIRVGRPVTGVALSPGSATIMSGANRQLAVTVYPTGWNGATVTDVIWSSDNEDVATVNSNGRVTGVSPGEAQITVTTVDGGFTATSDITVIWGATSISGGSTSFTVTFNVPISHAVMNGVTVNATNGNQITYTQSGGFSANDYDIIVTPINGTPKTIRVRLNIGYILWFPISWTWSIVNP